jgi:hypothetical protein
MLMPIIPSLVSYKTGAVTFDGTNDYMLRGGDFTGMADGEKGIFSCWVKLNGGNGSNLVLCSIPGPFFDVRRNSSNQFIISGQSTTPASVLNFLTSSTYTSSSTWLHVLASWDLSLTTGKIYISNSDDTSGTHTFVNDNIDYTGTDHSVGATTGGGSKLNADIADLYLNLSAYLDLSNSANRAKFINQTTLKPVNLGADGSLPTGTAPISFQRCAPGAAASTFATNLGTGGNFTITGALTAASNSPSD